MGIVVDVAPESSIFILAFPEPTDKFIDFGWGKLMPEGCETGERPVAAGDLEMFGEVLANGVEILAVLKGENVLDVFLLIKFDVLGILHKYYNEKGGGDCREWRGRVHYF